MTAINQTGICITEIVYDMMLKNVNCVSLLKNRISYIICNEAKQLIRKANFTGYTVN